MSLRARFLVIASLACVIAVSSALAGQPVTQTLTPSPPSFYTCKAVGSGTICMGSHSESFGPEETGLVCGTGTSAFHVFDTVTSTQRATRYYDREGNLTRRVLYDDIDGQSSNPLTGATVPYIQHEQHTAVLAVPGDLSTATTTHTGVLIFTIPHLGPVALEAGRVIEGPDGVEFRAGPQTFVDYYENGDVSAVRELCNALGTT
jgi:hypothetical protein